MAKNVKNFFKNYNYAWGFKLTVCLPIFLSLVGVDWISKLIVQITMEQGSTVSFIPGFLEFNYVINLGSAYGFNANNLAIAAGLATAMTVLLIVAFIFINGKTFLVGLIIVIAGSFANLVGRAWTPAITYDPTGLGTIGARGGVIDFLHWQFTWLNSDGYIFNLADVWVILGVVFVLLGTIYEVITLGVRKSRTSGKDDDELHFEEEPSAESKAPTKKTTPRKVSYEKKTVKKTTTTTKKPAAKKPVVAKPAVKKVKPKPRFQFKDEDKLTPKELKQYRKELKAYWKMKEMEQKQHAKKNRQSRK